MRKKNKSIKEVEEQKEMRSPFIGENKQNELLSIIIGSLYACAGGPLKGGSNVIKPKPSHLVARSSS